MICCESKVAAMAKVLRTLMGVRLLVLAKTCSVFRTPLSLRATQFAIPVFVNLGQIEHHEFLKLFADECLVGCFIWVFGSKSENLKNNLHNSASMEAWFYCCS